ncbi:MAG: hypothetical protein R6W31_09500 [Bacteroidales bacterium]
MDKWRYHFGTSIKEIVGFRVPHFAFGEYGVNESPEAGILVEWLKGLGVFWLSD